MATDLSGGRILVVDDDRVNRVLLTRCLEREGHRGRVRRAREGVDDQALDAGPGAGC
jgi:CheY-like chemotaxis protein